MNEQALNIVLVLVSVIMVGNLALGIMSLSEDWALLIAWFFPIIYGLKVYRPQIRDTWSAPVAALFVSADRRS